MPDKLMAVEVVAHIDSLRQRLAAARRDGLTIGFVPTMGALHAGHVQLMQHARHDHGHIVVSVFVNPLQFDRPDDLVRYPRTLDTDLAACQSAGVDVVFAPAVAEMYPTPPLSTVTVGRVADHLCGRFRPGHFGGVATVVMKLMQIVQPDTAYFGEKDAQQLAVIRRMVKDLNVPVTIAGVPTVRESDGLALSSRNQRLSPEERPLATALYRALRAAESLVAAGEGNSATVLARAAATMPADDRLRLEYLEIVDEDDFQPIARIAGPAVVAGALWVGQTRLIDNLRLTPPGRP